MTDKYKIHSIWYSKPHFTRDGHGEILHYRIGVILTVGSLADFDGLAPKKVIRIEFNDELRHFEIHFEKGGMRTVPMLADTEVTYQVINEKSSK